MNTGRCFRIVLMLCLIAGIMAFLSIRIFGPIVPAKTLSSVQIGDKKSRVIEILGKPNEVTEQGQWIYTRALNPGWVAITFDTEGRVVVVNNESVFGTE